MLFRGSSSDCLKTLGVYEGLEKTADYDIIITSNPEVS